MLLRNLKSKALGASRHALVATTLAATVALTGVVASQPASAAGAITAWDFEIDNGFFSMGPDAFTPAGTPPNGVVGSVPNAVLSASESQMMWTHLEWGAGDPNDGRSSVDVGSSSAGNFTGSLFTNGPAVNTVMIAHDNQAIPNTATTLLTATLLDVLQLTPTADEMGPIVGGSTTTFPPLMFDIYFKETENNPVDPNTGDPVPCDPSTTAPKPCSDIFAIDVTGAGFNDQLQIVQDISAFIPENDEGFEYFAIIEIDGLQLLDKATCDATGFPMASLNDDDMCHGLLTQENMMNQFQVTFQITSPDLVPEPGSLAILAFGLAGLGFAARRKRMV